MTAANGFTNVGGEVATLVGAFPSTAISIRLLVDETTVLTVLTTFVSCTELSFVTPPVPVTNPTYVPFELVVLGESGETVATRPGNRPAKIFFFAGQSACNKGNGCQISCSAGGLCSEGGRTWPKDGYWSRSESEPPLACDMDAICVGALGTTPGYPVAFLASGARKTDQCRTGYTGRACSSCQPGFFSHFGMCHACDKSGAPEKIAAGVIILVLVLGLAWTLVRASPATCVASLSCLVLLQTLVSMSRIGIRYTNPTEVPDWMQAASRAASVLLLDVEGLLRPGCGVDSMSVLGMFWVDLGVVLGSVALVLGLTWIRKRWGWAARFARVTDPSLELVPQIHNMSYTFVALAWGCAGTVLLSVRTMQSLYCREDPLGGGYVLVVEPGTKCYDGLHLFTLPALGVVTLFLLGLPLLGLSKLSTSAWLGLSLEPRFVWVRPLRLVFILAMSAGAVFAETPPVKVFGASMVFVANGICVGALTPFSQAGVNILNVVVSLAGSLLSLAFLFLLGNERWVWIELAVCAAAVFLASAFWCYSSSRSASRDQTSPKTGSATSGVSDEYDGDDELEMGGLVSIPVGVGKGGHEYDDDDDYDGDDVDYEDGYVPMAQPEPQTGSSCLDDDVTDDRSDRCLDRCSNDEDDVMVSHDTTVSALSASSDHLSEALSNPTLPLPPSSPSSSSISSEIELDPVHEALVKCGARCSARGEEVESALRWMNLSGIKSLGQLKLWSAGELADIGVPPELAKQLDTDGYVTSPLTHGKLPRQWASMTPTQVRDIHQAEKQRRATVLLGARRFRLTQSLPRPPPSPSSLP